MRQTENTMHHDPIWLRPLHVGAPWIWTAADGPGDTWMCFRHEVTLEKVPESVPAILAADSIYWLWINGVAVVEGGGLKRGPTPSDTYADRLDLAKYLRPGTNQIAALVWYYGINAPPILIAVKVDSFSIHQLQTCAPVLVGGFAFIRDFNLGRRRLLLGILSGQESHGADFFSAANGKGHVVGVHRSVSTPAWISLIGKKRHRQRIGQRPAKRAPRRRFRGENSFPVRFRSSEPGSRNPIRIMTSLAFHSGPSHSDWNLAGESPGVPAAPRASGGRTRNSHPY